MFDAVAPCLISIIAPSKIDVAFPGLRLPRMPETVDEAFRRDWKMLGKDMRKAINKAAGNVQRKKQS